jgi:Ala-tRNA(Pro) deacylase
MRVQTFLAEHHVAFDTIIHPPAFTASKRARFLHVPGNQLAKCVLLAGQGAAFLAVLPATQKVDLAALEKPLGGPVTLANAEEIAATFGDCEWGSLVPFGRLYGVPSLLDISFHPDALLVFEAHRHAVAIRMRCCDFVRLELPWRLALGLGQAFRPGTNDPKSRKWG